MALEFRNTPLSELAKASSGKSSRSKKKKKGFLSDSPLDSANYSYLDEGPEGEQWKSKFSSAYSNEAFKWFGPKFKARFQRGLHQYGMDLSPMRRKYGDPKDVTEGKHSLDKTRMTIRDTDKPKETAEVLDFMTARSPAQKRLFKKKIQRGYVQKRSPARIV